MINRLIFLILLIGLFVNNKGYSKWEVVDSIPFTQAFFAVECYDKDNCVALGNNSFLFATVQRTTDGGKSWKTTLNDDTITNNGTESFGPTYAYSLSYPGPKTCIVGCDTGTYWLSKDNAATWNKFRFNETRKASIIIMHDEKFGGMTDNYIFMITQDGGYHWQKVNFNIADSNYMPEMFLYFSIPDTNTIIIAAHRTDNFIYIIKSNDRGLNWTYYPRKIETFGDIFFKDSLVGFTTGTYKVAPMTRPDVVFKTTDGGKTWVKKLDTLTSDYAYGLKKIIWKNNLMMAFGDYDHYWISTDFGETWQRDWTINNLKLKDYFNDICMPEENIAYSVVYWRDRIYKNESFNDVPSSNRSDFDYCKLSKNILNNGDNIVLEFSDCVIGSVNIDIYNDLGELLDSETLEYLTIKQSLKFSTDRLTAGLYFISIKVNKVQQILKFIVI